MNALKKKNRPTEAKPAALAIIGVSGIGGSMALLLTGDGEWPSYVGAVGMVLAAVAFGATAGRLYGGDPVRPALRGFLIGFLVSIIAYALLLLGTIRLDAAGLAHGALGYAAALAPALALAGAFASLGIYLRREPDDLLRRVAVESLLWGLGGVLALATAWGILEGFGLAPHLQLWVVAPVFAVLVGVAHGLVAWRYR
ncbi:hypothetical protein DMC25_13830 [Caulobacter sp. D4A]|uniref:hypothetical protein n=1 Tax=unclassified Caulobacter TaxID=2648921 RepID=UPI000D736170|nr:MULTISPECIES: hypothetical protein [unclassified Caulobacter]PXA86490.1 hypothetical protein DMC25_13830 [Caulobacter sp. D4A]PXA89870.1 hypothetical protein DMC18_15910 [Caulobacter sp. D5]